MPADDLEDDFFPDALNAHSDLEDSLEESSEEWNGIDDLVLESSPIPRTPSASSSLLPVADVSGATKRKRRQKEKERKAKKRCLAGPIQDDLNVSSAAASPPDVLIQFLTKHQIKALSNLSAIELDEWRIPEAAIANTSAWSGSRSLEILPEFIAKTLPTLKTRLAQRPKSTGSPTLIFVAGAALRVADATRVLKRMKDESHSVKAGDIAKLFAKHFKLEEHASYLRRTRIGAAVGTPGRLGRLLSDTDSLSTTALTHIMIDATFQDAKKRTIFDIPETREELFRLLLGAKAVKQGLERGTVSVVLF